MDSRAGLCLCAREVGALGACVGTPVCAGGGGGAGLCSTDSETHFFSLPITEVEMFHWRWRVTM